MCVWCVRRGCTYGARCVVLTYNLCVSRGVLVLVTSAQSPTIEYIINNGLFYKRISCKRKKGNKGQACHCYTHSATADARRKPPGVRTWLFCSILYSMLQCYIASIRCYSTI